MSNVLENWIFEVIQIPLKSQLLLLFISHSTHRRAPPSCNLAGSTSCTMCPVGAYAMYEGECS